MEQNIFRKFVLLISYTAFLLLIIFTADVIYVKLFERLPPLRQKVYLQMFESSIHQRSEREGLFYELKRNAENGRFRTNSFGMRDNEPGPAKHRYRVLVMGDSVTFGSEVEKEELFTEVAEGILNADSPKSEILNAGTCGYNTRQEFIALKEKYLSLHPDLVIFAFCVNDPEEAAIQFLPDDYAQKEIMQSGIKPQDLHFRNLSDRQYLAVALPRQFAFGYELDRWLLLHSGIYRAFSILKFKVAHGIPDLRRLPDHIFAYDFDRLLREIRELSARNGFAVRFVFLPLQQSQWNKDQIKQGLVKNGIPFWDFDLEIRESYGADYNSFFCDQVHLSQHGHSAVGKLLAKKIKTLIH